VTEESAQPDLGGPASYLVLEGGEPVYSCDGEQVGVVEHLLADAEIDIFDGLVLDTSVLPGGHRFVDADQVEEVFERGVLLKLTREQADSLPEPSENPATMEADPAEGTESELQRKLRRAWDLISGRG
jgi:uncharacterized protein YrrD